MANRLIIVSAVIAIVFSASAVYAPPEPVENATGRETDAARQGDDDAPVPIPSVLPNGAVRKFMRAASARTFPYSGSSVIKVYTYAEPGLAATDLAVFVKALEKNGLKSVTAGEDKAVSARSGAYRLDEAGITVYFRFEEYIIEIRLRTAGAKLADAFGVCRQIIELETKRRHELFRTIDRAFATYLEAVEKRSRCMLARCFPAAYIAENEQFMDSLLADVETFTARYEAYMRHSSLNVKFLRSITEGKTGWALVVLSGKRHYYEPPWMQVLRGGAGLSGSSEPRTYWIPYVLEHGLWKIDLAGIRKSGIVIRRAPDNRTLVTAFLRSVALAQEEFRTRDLDGDSARDYASSLDELCKAGLPPDTVKNGKAWGYEFRFAASKDNKTWSLSAVHKKTSEEKDDKENSFYIDQTGVLRVEKGKPAGPASDEYSVSGASGTPRPSKRGVFTRTIIIEGEADIEDITINNEVFKEAMKNMDELKKKHEALKKKLDELKNNVEKKEK
jgi:hypothetical protein